MEILASKNIIELEPLIVTNRRGIKYQLKDGRNSFNKMPDQSKSKRNSKSEKIDPIELERMMWRERHTDADGMLCAGENIHECMKQGRSMSQKFAEINLY